MPHNEYLQMLVSHVTNISFSCPLVFGLEEVVCCRDFKFPPPAFLPGVAMCGVLSTWSMQKLQAGNESSHVTYTHLLLCVQYPVSSVWETVSYPWLPSLLLILAVPKQSILLPEIKTKFRKQTALCWHSSAHTRKTSLVPANFCKRCAISLL